jgi:hypothetical protein
VRSCLPQFRIDRESCDTEGHRGEARGQRVPTVTGAAWALATSRISPRVEFLQTFAELIRRFNLASDGTTKIRSDYFVIRVER